MQTLFLIVVSVLGFGTVPQNSSLSTCFPDLAHNRDGRLLLRRQSIKDITGRQRTNEDVKEVFKADCGNVTSTLW